MDVMELVSYLIRWGHYLFGITWIGLLYYFNFVQGGYMAAASDEAKVDAFTKLVPSALWWFRWGAMLTFLTGLLLLVLIWSALTPGILLSGLMATLMFLNVWLVIWPNQKVVIASNEKVRDGGSADPNAAGSAAKALLASRTNTFFSAPMLFLMGAHSHFNFSAGVHGSLMEMIQTQWLALLVGVVIIVAIEANALFGKLYTLASVRGVIISSLVLTVVLYIVAGL